MMATNQRIWGYETNFGGLADLAVVKANQLMPKPAHLTWEEAAVNALCNSTSYRMLVSRNGAAMKQGDVVLIWGATGGIGAYAAQYVLNGGGIPVCVVSSADKAEILQQDGRRGGHRSARRPATSSGRTSTPTTRASGAGWARTSASSSARTPTSSSSIPADRRSRASMYVAKRGGTVVSCAATSGFMLEFDNRHFWMRLKRLIGSHFANYKEAWEANRLIAKGMIHPVLSQVFALEQTPARPHTRCTTTCTRASSACCAWRRPRASA